MPLATGLDLVEIHRFARAVERQGERFLARIFTQRELRLTGGNINSLAVRFAAKEALAKALCTGIGPISWHEVEILRGEAKEPVIKLHGEAARLAFEQGLHVWSLSLSHTETTAAAFVVAMGETDGRSG